MSHDGDGTQVAIVNAFTTVNPETEATVRAVDYQVVGAAPGQFRVYSDDERDAAQRRFLGVADAGFDLALPIGIADAARQGDDAVVGEHVVPPIYVKPFVKRQKNDAADAEAICEAASRPTMRFMAVKTQEQQSQGMLFRTRDLLVRQRTQTINALRGHFAEFGVVAPQGPAHVERLAEAIEDADSPLPGPVRELGALLFVQIAELNERIVELERDLRERAREDERTERLENFRRGRDFAAWLGLVPRQSSTGGKPKLGRISKMGQRDLRRLLVVGAMATVGWAARRGTKDPWLARMLARKPRMLVAMALASQRIAAIPGVGLLGATAAVAAMGDPATFGPVLVRSGVCRLAGASIKISLSLIGTSLPTSRSRWVFTISDSCTRWGNCVSATHRRQHPSAPDRRQSSTGVFTRGREPVAR